MSLLLDAMKKSGDKSQSTGLSNMSLEEPVPSASRSAPTPEPSTTTARAAGQALFAAKKKKAEPRFRWTLGLIPTTLIICSVIGSIYGYYVWRELNPPAPQIVQRPIAPPLLPLQRPHPHRWSPRLRPPHNQRSMWLHPLPLPCQKQRRC